MSSMVVITAAGPGVYVASFVGLTPPPRFGQDDVDVGGWTILRVSEAAGRRGPFTLLGQAELEPDQDPTRPQARAVTVLGCTLQAGWYSFEFVDQDGNVQPVAPIHNGAVWRPSVQDVANESPAYTTRLDDPDPEGQPVYGFTDQTSPTAADVRGFIDAGVREVAGRVGISDDTIAALADLARTTVMWHAAAAVEAERNTEGNAATAGAFSWKQSSYVACLRELTDQARRTALRLT